MRDLAELGETVGDVFERQGRELSDVIAAAAAAVRSMSEQFETTVSGSDHANVRLMRDHLGAIAVGLDDVAASIETASAASQRFLDDAGCA